MTDETWLNPTKGPADNEVAFDYVKSPDFKVVWADGAIGSITPRGLIHFAIYAERPAIPRRQVFKINDEDDGYGTLGSEVTEKQISRGSIVRELSCDVFLTPAGAASLAAWLTETVATHKNLSEAEE